ncbi:hypothetical protein [Aneurinibacillus uraniidurans]|uniref:hypothetical protein n=1 Tax=Aneurinibacillus uraniidurans TaxID=2966586 RepID=UPI00234AB1AD|nr:hypothetical protein [Aneurinibacillus sp. B1]WCN38149.1 hypothetical protein PO771_01595 [Aneurinibacillus sp. B1]
MGMYVQEKQQLLCLFQEQTEGLLQSIEQENYDQVEEYFELRAQIINRINQLDAAFPQELVQSRGTLQALLVEISLNDQKLQDVLKQQHKNVSEQLKKLHMARQTNRSYAQSAYSTEGYFVDETIRPGWKT